MENGNNTFGKNGRELSSGCYFRRRTLCRGEKYVPGGIKEKREGKENGTKTIVDLKMVGSDPFFYHRSSVIPERHGTRETFKNHSDKLHNSVKETISASWHEPLASLINPDPPFSARTLAKDEPRFLEVSRK